MRRHPVLTALLSTSLACIASAQSVQGHITSAATARPLGGAIVQLVDTTGVGSAGTLVKGDGSFALMAPRTGRYTLRTLRIGFKPGSFGPVNVGTTGVAGITV